MDSMEKRACNLVQLTKIQTEAKNSNKLRKSYCAKGAKVTKNSTILYKFTHLNFVIYMG